MADNTAQGKCAHAIYYYYLVKQADGSLDKELPLAGTILCCTSIVSEQRVCEIPEYEWIDIRKR